MSGAIAAVSVAGAAVAGSGALGAISAPTIFAGLSAAAALDGVYHAVTAPKPKAPALATPTAPPTQSAVTPAASTLAATSGAPAGSGGGSQPSTLLTSGQGVDPSKLALGKSTLLGS